MRRRLVPALRGALVCAVLWAVVATFVRLIFGAVDDGPAGPADGVGALELGINAFVVCIAALLGSYVTGSGLVEADVPRTLPAATLAWLVPVVVVAAARVTVTALSGADRAVDLAFLAAGLAGGLAGAVVSVIRARDDEDAPFEARARRAGHGQSVGWRTR